MRRRGAAATIYDVAELAGVSPSTVSRALSTPGRISRSTEAKIRAAADVLDFRVNPMARALHTGRTRTLAVVVADITNPVVFGIIRGAEREASSHDHTMVVAESQESGTTEAAAVQRILPSVDGIVLATTRLSDERIRAIASRKPAALINREVDGVPGIVPDIEAGVTDLVAHLHGLGHRSIVYLSGPADSWMNDRRRVHLLAASGRSGMAVAEIGPNAPTIDGGRAVLRRVLAARPTAVVAYNDLMAIGLMQAAAAEGVDVPAQLSVAGFDDIFGAELIVPALTTVRAPLEEAGGYAVKSLVARLNDTTVAMDEPLRTEFVARRSTARSPS